MLFTRKGRIENAKPGQVFTFCYGKNESVGEVKRTGRVLSVRDTYRYPILRSSELRRPINRSRYLITVQDAQGIIRNFYGEKIAAGSRRVTWLGLLVRRALTSNINHFFAA